MPDEVISVEGLEKEEKNQEIEIDVNRAKKIIEKYWVIPALFIIILLAYNTRLVGFNFPYLRNIDSYYFYRYTEFVVEQGRIPETDPYMLAPTGQDTTHKPMLYPYLSAYSYMFVRMFKPDLELWQFFIYFPAFLAALAGVPAYFIGRELFDRKAGVLAAVFMVFNPFNMTRTLGGDPDSDAIVILLTLTSVACFLLMYKLVEKRRRVDKRVALYSVIAGLALAAFANTWGGSWYVFWLFLGFAVSKFVIKVLVKRDVHDAWSEAKPEVKAYAIFLLIFLLFTIPFLGFNYPLDLVKAPLSSFGLKAEAHTKFPNVYVSVAEMLAPQGGLSTVTKRVGNSLFIMSMLSLIYFAASFFVKRRHLDSFLFGLIWFVGPLVASITAIRFVVLLSAPVTILGSIFLAKVWRIVLGQDGSVFD